MGYLGGVFKRTIGRFLGDFRVKIMGQKMGQKNFMDQIIGPKCENF